MYLCQYTIRGTFLSGLVLVLMSEKCRLIMFKEFENWRQFSLITSAWHLPEIRPVTQPMSMDHLKPIENAFKYVCPTAVNNEDKMILALILEFIMLEIVIVPQSDHWQCLSRTHCLTH